MIFLRLILVNLLRHKIRTFISIAVRGPMASA